MRAIKPLLILFPLLLLIARDCEALTQDLVAYWRLEEVSGTRVDATGRGNDLTDNNTVTQAVGKVGNAAQFTVANSECLSHVDNADLSMGDIDFSVVAWVFLDSKGAPVQGFVGQYSFGDDLRAYLLSREASTDRFRFSVSGNGTLSQTTHLLANALGVPGVSTWYLIIAWHDATANTINIQVNDGAVNSAAHTTGVFNSTASFRLGCLLSSGTPTEFMDGRIDEVGIWKRVLTADERSAIWNNGNGRNIFPKKQRTIVIVE